LNEQAQTTRAILLGGISMGNETLLVVDDNEALREGLSEMLSFEGFTVVAAENGLEALEKMQVISPDLIISDITMPQMDGYGFFNAVRAQPEWVTIPFIFLTARAEREDIMAGKNMGAEDYLVKPLSREELVTAVRARLARSRQLEMAQLQQAYEASLTALANAIDLRDRYTRGHVERVTAYAMTIAACMEWPKWRIEQLRFGSILHDIGKIHIRETTLFKVTVLTEEEWAEIKRHPANGAEMIKDIPYLTTAVPIVRHHHERWDGKGYPDRLAGDAIPIEARIVAIADAFDAMTTERPYSPRRDLEEAFDEILNCSGKQYDPEVVKAFQKAWESGEMHRIKSAWK
jgi:putative two-component system response regulator